MALGGIQECDEFAAVVLLCFASRSLCLMDKIVLSLESEQGWLITFSATWTRGSFLNEMQPNKCCLWDFLSSTLF